MAGVRLLNRGKHQFPTWESVTPGADYITYDPSSRSVIVWDAKYRAPGGSYPTSLPDSKLQAWQSEIINSVKNMPEGSAKAAAESALKAGRVEGRIFKWPQ